MNINTTSQNSLNNGSRECEKVIEEIIEKYQLAPHPEGGYYRETYRSEEIVEKECLDAGYIGKRNCSTAIYFLLTANMFSAFHKLKQDEIWHFYYGSPVKIHMISEKGEYNTVILGNNYNNNETPQFVIKGNTWFAAEVNAEGCFSFVGCTVSPGFDFADFEIAEREKLIKDFPVHKEVITKFTKKQSELQ